LTASRAKAASAKKPVYRLAFEKHARAEWDKLDGSVKEPLRQLLKKRLEAPHLPSAALRGDLAHCYKIKLLKQGYRLIYQVIDLQLIVLVISVGKRDKNAVYAAAIKRLQAQR
jgi:mRNA interferase RelE/StbE